MKKYFNNGREYKIYLLNKLYPPYWDECLTFHVRKKFSKKKRLVTHKEYRSFRTWKHTRLTQFKVTNKSPYRFGEGLNHLVNHYKNYSGMWLNIWVIIGTVQPLPITLIAFISGKTDV